MSRSPHRPGHPGPTSPSSQFAAWLDESGSNHKLDPNTYMIAAAVFLDESVDQAREAMEGLRMPGERKIHWRDDSPERHLEVATAIAHMDAIEHVVVVRSRPDDGSDSTARRRSKVLERVLCELTAMGVGQAVIESRGKADDRRDLKVLDHLRRKQSLPGKIRIDHTPGPRDPLLWVPDAVCGVVSQHRCGNPANYEMLESRLTVLEI